MGVGSGGFMAAKHAFQQAKKEMERVARDRALRRQNRLVRLKRAEHPSAATRVKFPCFVMCGGCHYIAPTAPERCPACDEHIWLDLASNTVSAKLTDHEAVQRLKAPTWAKGVVSSVSVAGSAAAAATSITQLGLSGATFLITGGAVVAATLLYAFGVRPLARAVLRRYKGTPHRWHLPVPLATPKSQPLATVSGELRAKGELLTAPFSGKPCVAYHACVIFDAPGGYRPFEWLLEEMRSIDVEVGEHRLTAGHVFLEGKLELVQGETSDATLTRFLRERGLFSYEGDFTLFELIAEPGQAVKATVYPPPAAAVLHTS